VARAQLVCASAENIPFPGGSFDLIFCVNAFHHFSDPKKFLRDSRLLLRNGGQLAIFGLDPHAPNTDWYLCDYFPGVRAVDLKRYLPVAEVERLMAKRGSATRFAQPAAHIQKTFTGEAVFQDPFLVRESTSQLLLISEDVYLNGNEPLHPQSRRQSGKSAQFSFVLT